MLKKRTATVLLFTAVVTLLNRPLTASEYTQKDLNEEIVIAANWQHYSAEYDALFYQTFNMARQNLPEAIKKAPKGKKLAIVTDIDDTLVDGATYFTSLRGTNDERSAGRSIQWWSSQPTYALPGALRFFRDVHEQGIEIFYISGRFNEVKGATCEKLRELGFPVRDKEHILLQETASNTLSKEGKRQSIRDKGYHILMVFGDQLSDLAEVHGDNYRERRQWVTANESHFGADWYFLPNVVYGAWEDSLTPNYPKLSPQEKHDSRIAALSDFRFHVITDPDYAQHLTLASVWMHTSADYTALCYQAYNQAERLISQKPADSYENPVIIADIDGTVLDFTTFRANLTDSEKSRRPINHSWFLNEYQYSKVIPGAVEFLNFARQQGYEVFYVSSRPLSKNPETRDTDIETATIEKLSSYNFPFADSQHVLLQEEYCATHHRNHCGKEAQREAIQNGSIDDKKHDIVLMIGDLLSDFSLKEQQPDPDLKETAAAAETQFGTDYIVLPNPLNTLWMRQLYGREAQKQNREFTSMSWKEQAELRRSLVRDWPDKSRQ